MRVNILTDPYNNNHNSDKNMYTASVNNEL